MKENTYSDSKRISTHVYAKIKVYSLYKN